MPCPRLFHQRAGFVCPQYTRSYQEKATPMLAEAPAKLTAKKRTAGEWRPAFLSALRNSANIRAACLAAGISRETAYNHREYSAEFRAAWETAWEEAIDVLEAVAFQRAQKSSDVLVIFMLKANRPAKYRETIKIDLTAYIHARAAELGLSPEVAERVTRSTLSVVG